MDEATARGVLGVAATAPWPEVRAAYLRLVRDHHPDRVEDLAERGRRTVVTARITEAFAVVTAARRTGPTRATPDPAETDERSAAYIRHPATGADELRSVLLDAAPMDAFLALLETFSVVGAVSYVDRLSLVLETIVTPVPGRATSLLAWLEPAGPELTAATLGVESLGGHPPADLDALVDRIATLLAAPRPPVEST
jgi:hypothetical protein